MLGTGRRYAKRLRDSDRARYQRIVRTIKQVAPFFRDFVLQPELGTGPRRPIAARVPAGSTAQTSCQPGSIGCGMASAWFAPPEPERDMPTQQATGVGDGEPRESQRAAACWLSAQQPREWPPVIVCGGIEGAYLPPVDGLQAQPPQPFLPRSRADVQMMA